MNIRKIESLISELGFSLVDGNSLEQTIDGVWYQVELSARNRDSDSDLYWLVKFFTNNTECRASKAVSEDQIKKKWEDFKNGKNAYSSF